MGVMKRGCIICGVRIRRSAGEHRTRRTLANRRLRQHWPPDTMPRRCCEFVDSRLRRSPPGHLAIYTKAPFSFFPYMVPTMLIVSSTQWEKAGRNWSEFGKSPAGTGPFKITRVVSGQYVEVSRYEGYWDNHRIPKLAKVVLIPMPVATTRLAALRS